VAGTSAPGCRPTARDKIVLDLHHLDVRRVDHQLAPPGPPGIGYRHGENRGRPEAFIASGSDRA